MTRTVCNGATENVPSSTSTDKTFSMELNTDNKSEGEALQSDMRNVRQCGVAMT